MPDGDMRRPPQLWEQKLLKLIGVGSSGLTIGGATSSGGAAGGGGGGGGLIPTPEPGPELPPPGAFIKPSTPQLTGAVQGIRVRWDGLNADGDLWPYDTSWIEVHMATSGTGFTPDGTTLKGRLDYPGEFFVGGLAAGTTYHFRLRGADPAGNFTEPSDAASGQTGLTTSSDYGTATITSGAVSFNARQIGGVTSTVGTVTPTSPVVGDIWLDTTGGSTTHKRWNGTTWETILFGSGSIANNAITEVKIDTAAITAAKIAASAVTETKIASDAVTSPKILAGAVTAGKITAGAVTAEKIAASAVEADKIAANAVTAGKIAANTITGDKIAANTITSSLIAANTITATNIATGAITAGAIAAGAVTAEKITADAINGMTIVGATFLTAGTVGTFGNPGIVINTSAVSGYDSLGNLNFQLSAFDGKLTTTNGIFTSGEITGGTVTGTVIRTDSSTAVNRVVIDGSAAKDRVSWRNTGSGQYFMYISGDNFILDASSVSGAFRVLTPIRLEDALNSASSSVPNVRINTSTGEIKETTHANSAQRFKHEIVALTDGGLAGPVDSALLGTESDQVVDPTDVLDITPIQYRRNADPLSVVTGFLAEDVEQKFPTAAAYDDDGVLETIDERAILAALLAVVRDQQATITDLRIRIEALEA